MGTGVTLCEYNPAWPAHFERVCEEIRGALGDGSYAIEHIGSTAVPGIAAKPVIDVMVGVAGLEGVLEQFQEPLQGIGFQWMEAFRERLPNRVFFYRDTAAGQRAENVHVVVRNGPVWVRHLAFRDVLRAKPAVAQEYERLKRELAPRFDDSTLYSDAKTSWIRAIERRALSGGKYV